jgi:N-acetyl-anhydromuramyl-L-alanine amidase AmpD
MRVSGIPYVQGRNSYSDPDGTKYGIAIHNTSNNATAEAEASYATRRTDGVSSHFYCDGDSVIQSLDTIARAGHAGSSAGNNNAVAVEITGVNGWTRQQWLSNVAWGLLGRVLAQVCTAYGVTVRRASVAEMQSNPRVKAFYGHDDMRRAWGGTDHTDPGPNFPWDRLFAAVNAALNPSAAAEESTVPTYSAPNPNAGENVEEMLRALLTGLPTYTGNTNTALVGKVKGMGGEPYPTPAALYPKLEAILTAARAGGWSQEQRDALAEDLATRAFDKLAAKFGDALINALVDPRAIEAYRQGSNAAEDS